MDGKASKGNVFTDKVADRRAFKGDIFTERLWMKRLPSATTYLQKGAEGPRWDWVLPDS